MIRVVGAFGMCFALAACAATPRPEPVAATVEGPRFPATAFECGREPSPPDPKTVGEQGGSAAARYENRLVAWGGGCRRKLNSVGGQLRSAGQVVE